MNHVQQWLRFFEQVSSFCKADMFFSWRRYPNYDTDIWHSLCIFCESYAFERQGRRPDYFHAAVDTLRKYEKKDIDNMHESIVRNIWKDFKNRLNNQDLNHQNNPLCPKGTEYPTKNRKEPCKTRKQSIIELVFSEVVPERLTFTSYFENKIAQAHDIQDAHKALKSIQGISDKIASLYLRDLTYIKEIDLSNGQNRRILQPVDTWVARAVIRLAGNEFSLLKRKIKNRQQLNNKEKAELAEWIVRESNENAVNPELVNMGIWYFCSQIARSEYRLNRVLEDLNDLSDAGSLVHEYGRRIKNTYQNCRNFAQSP